MSMHRSLKPKRISVSSRATPNQRRASVRKRRQQQTNRLRLESGARAAGISVATLENQRYQEVIKVARLSHAGKIVVSSPDSDYHHDTGSSWRRR